MEASKAFTLVGTGMVSDESSQAADDIMIASSWAHQLSLLSFTSTKPGSWGRACPHRAGSSIGPGDPQRQRRTTGFFLSGSSLGSWAFNWIGAGWWDSNLCHCRQ